jgi:hypothetical protein
LHAISRQALLRLQKGDSMNAQLHERVLFRMGRIVATAAATEVLERVPFASLELLVRHVTGDFGLVGEEDAAANRDAIRNDSRVVSVYEVAGERIWLITEADRSVTTFLLPEEY